MSEILSAAVPAQVGCRSAFEIVVQCRLDDPGRPVDLGCAIHDEDGRLVFSSSTAHAAGSAPLEIGEQTVRLQVADNRLLAGRYRVDVYLLADGGREVLARQVGAACFDVPMGPMQGGVVLLDHSWARGPTDNGEVQLEDGPLFSFDVDRLLLQPGESIEIEAPAPPDARLIVELSAPAGPTTLRIEVAGRLLHQETLEDHRPTGPLAIPLHSAFQDHSNPFLAQAHLAPSPRLTPGRLTFRFSVEGSAAGEFRGPHLALPELGVTQADRLPFDRVQLEAAEPCDAHCTLCYRSYYSAGFKGPIMTADSWDRMKPFLSELTQIDLGGWGEPTLNNRLPQMIRDSRAAGIPYIIFATHGNRIDAALAEELVEAGPTHINISIDGGTEETVARIRAGTSLAKALAAMSHLRSARERRSLTGPRIQGSYVMRTSNLAELPAFVRQVAQAGGDEVILRNAIAFGPDDFEEVQHEGFYEVRVDTERRDQLLTEAYAEAERLGVSMLMVGPLTIEQRFSGCFCQAERSPFIGGAGDVSPCCFLGHPVYRVTAQGEVVNHGLLRFGNINETSLDEIWNSSAYTRFRAQLRLGQSAECRDCPCLFLFTRNPDEVRQGEPAA